MRSLFQLLGALGLTILVLVGWLMVRLADGPVSLSFMLPYLETALSRPDGSLTVRIGDTVLAWSRESHLFEIKALESHAFGADGHLIADLPELSITLSGLGLLEGQLVPRVVRVLHPAIRLVRDMDGHVRFGLAKTTDAEIDESGLPVAGDTVAALLTPAENGDDGFGSLRRIEVVDGTLVIEDRILDKTWHAPKIDLRLVRIKKGISAHSHVDLDLDGQLASMDADGTFLSEQKSFDATITGQSLQLAPFANLAPMLAPLQALQIPVTGTVVVHEQLGQGLTGVRVDLSGGAGIIDASATLGIKTPVESLVLRGNYDASTSRLVLDSLRIDRGAGVVTLSGSVDGVGGDMHLDVQGRLQNLPFNALPALWPPDAAPNPRAWVLANIPRGITRTGDIHVTGHLAAGQALSEVSVDSLSGHLSGDEIALQYLAPMPMLANVGIDADFDLDAFRIHAHGGQVAGLTVPDGTIVLSGLSKPDQFAAIDVKINGPLSEALRIIGGKPLNWTRKLGVEPKSAMGDIATHLTLQFPLIQALDTNDIEAHADIQGTHIGLSKVLLDNDLDNGELSLTVDKAGLDLTGKARIGGVPTDLKWRENFGDKVSFRSRYQLTATLSDADRMLFGLGSALFQPPYLTGGVPAEVLATKVDEGQTTLDIKADLAPVALRLAGSNLDKAQDIAGTAQATLVLKEGRIESLPHFTITTANGIDVAGDVQFDEGQPRHVALQRAKWERTDIAALIDILPNDAGLALDLSGASLDVREMVAGTPSDRKQSDTPKARHTDDDEDVTPLKVRARVVRAWLTDDGAVTDIAATMERDHHHWRQAHLDAKVGPKDGEGKPVLIDLHPDGADKTRLQLSSGDAGAVLHDLGIYDDMAGGTLSVDGVYAETLPHRPLSGTARVTDFHVVHAPGLLRLLTVAALSGIANELQGQGISFSNLDAPFILTDGILKLSDSRAFGVALGLTAHGEVDLDNKNMALEGTIVPMYALNSAFDNVPLIGGLFSAEKGGGLVAMGYSVKGPMDDLDVTPYPLTALTPGFLRRFFDIFDRGADTVARPKEGLNP